MTRFSLRRICAAIACCALIGCARKPSPSAHRKNSNTAGAPSVKSADLSPSTSAPSIAKVKTAPPNTPTMGRIENIEVEPVLWAIDPDASQSVGTPQNGRLIGGLKLPSIPAIEVLKPTLKRGWLWGTSELISLVHDTAIMVAREHGAVPMRIGNLSRQGGGDISVSVSHNSGRDVDIGFYLIDSRGASASWPTMLRCDQAGVVQHPQKAHGLRFDTARNWTLISQLLSHPAVVVQWIFVAAPLRNMLLDHALRAGAPASLRQRAQQVMVQPSDSSAHDDHFHVRIACPSEDKPACLSGPGRTKLAREAQIDALLQMYRQGSPAEKRYATEILSLPSDGADLVLPPIETAGSSK